MPKSIRKHISIHQMHKIPANANTKETYVFLPTYHCMFSIVPASVFPDLAAMVLMAVEVLSCCSIAIYEMGP